MKNFLTRTVALAFLLLIGSTAYAQYKGDFQLVLGHDNMSFKIDDGKYKWKAHNFDIGLKSFNTYEIMNIVGIGLMGSCDLDLGKSINAKNSRTSDDFDFLIGFDAFLGPAVSFNIMDILALQGSIGYVWQCMAMFGDAEVSGIFRKSVDYNIYEYSQGWGFDIQAKLFPTAPVSAVFGMKSIFSGNSKYTIDFDGDTDTINDDVDIDSLKFYAGAALKL